MAAQILIDPTIVAITDPVVVKIGASVIPATLIAEGLTGGEVISVLVSIDSGGTTQQSYQNDSVVELTATNNIIAVNTPVTIGLTKPETGLSAGVFLSSGTARRSVAPPPLPGKQASRYDGVLDYQLRTGVAPGLVDGKKYLLSLFVFLDALEDGLEQRFFSVDFNEFHITRRSDTTLRLIGRAGGFSVILRHNSGVGFTVAADGKWHHIIASGDLATPGSGTMFIDDVQVDAPINFDNNDIIYTESHAIGATTTGFNKLRGRLSEYYINLTENIDLTVEANRRKFSDVNNKPVDLGSDGSLPTGTSPFVYAPNGDATNNKGTATGFVTQGALVPVSGPLFPTVFPTDFAGLGLWLDAADTATITETSDLVSQWDDKSGNNNHAVQPIGGEQPNTNIFALNGRNTIISVNRNMNISANAALTGIFATGGTIICVTQATDPSGLPRILDLVGQSELFLSNGGDDITFNAAFSGTDAEFSGNHALSAQATITTVTYDGSSVANTATFYSDGILEPPFGIIPPTGTIDSGTGEMVLGSDVALNNPFRGLLCEFILYNRIISDAERNALHDYLIDKWGVS